MTGVATLQPDATRIVACTISRDVQNFELLIDGMEHAMGESWGDLGFADSLLFFEQPEATLLEFVVLALDAEDEANLDQISEVIRSARTHRIRVILVADNVGPVALHHLMRLGAEDFLPYPLPEGALDEAIERLRAPEPEVPAAREAPEEERPRFKARGDRHGIVLPVHGLAGGVGATTFATNLAWELANADKNDPPRVCLIDLDLQYGTVATYLDLPRKDAVFEVLTDPQSVDSDALVKSMQTFSGRLSVLTAPPEMLPLDIISSEDLGRLIDLAIANFDFVVIDMPKTVVAWTEAVLMRAHVYFVLQELDLRSAQNTLRFVRALKAEALPHEKLRHVLNRAPKYTNLSARGRMKKMAESLDITFEVQLPDGGFQAFQANDHGVPLAESAARNPLRREIQRLAHSLHQLSKTVASEQN